MKVTGMVLWVQDNELSEKFYRKLGFKLVDKGESHTRVELDGFAIDLVSMRDEKEFSKDSMHPDKGRGAYLYINVNDVESMHKKLLNLGVKAVKEPRDWPWGNREFVIRDPDGYRLCFWSLITQKA